MLGYLTLSLLQLKTVGGNIVTNSSQSDLIPVLLATNASFNLVSSGELKFCAFVYDGHLFKVLRGLIDTGGTRVLSMVECMSWKEGDKSFLKPIEVLVSIVVPFSAKVCKYIVVHNFCRV